MAISEYLAYILILQTLRKILLIPNDDLKLAEAGSLFNERQYVYCTLTTEVSCTSALLH
ncbi:hypothetical protein PMIT1303_01008 [Prochlorococcus sp. MIT 1303]|nr:hypothetical protein PMIT1303_01008 [Prochlorococcus sp. MIT 1303]